MAQIPGLLKGMKVTFVTMLRTIFPGGLKNPMPSPSKGAYTIQYPHTKELPPARARGVIALHTENCTACMLCARECPDWCIYIEGHKELAPPRREGGKPRQVNELDRFDIDFALCMYCGICVEVCPFDALFWSPEFEYSEPKITDLLHDSKRLTAWMHTVPEFQEYESGSEQKVRTLPAPPEGTDTAQLDIEHDPDSAAQADVETEADTQEGS